MLDLNELEQLIIFADAGTLSMTEEKLHISQPAITRTMQHLEEVFGVSLFVRGKNKIMLNDMGIKAAEQSRQLLADKIKIPVTDTEANVTYYLTCHSQSIAYSDALKRINTNNIV